MGISIGIGLSTDKDHLQAVKEAIRQARATLTREKIDLALVFSSAEFAHPTVIKTIRDTLDQVPLLGATSIAILTNAGIFKHGLLIILLNLSKEISLRLAQAKEVNARPAARVGEDLGIKLLRDIGTIRRDFGLIFCDGPAPCACGLIAGLQERMGRSFPLVGGSVSDSLGLKHASIYFNQEILRDAACGVLFSGRLSFSTGVKHGWRPLGKPRRVTGASENVVHSIDGKPAIKIYEDYFAKSAAELKKELKRICLLYPLGIYLEGEKEYLLRNILSFQNDGSVAFQGDVPEGSSVRLMIGTKESCLEATYQAAQEAKRNFPGKKINLILFFDSASRYALLGRQAERELDIIRENIGRDTPMVGIYTYAEYAPMREIYYLGKSYFHNQAMAILAIGEQ
jgi:hypothetical protein